MENGNENDRVRAWVLAQVNGDWQATAKQIKTLDTKSPDLVIIRTDLVTAKEGSQFNLVVPIDAIDPDKLQNAVDYIRELTGSSVEVLEVTEHDPIPPHLADGFITKAEVDADPRSAAEFVKVGRQRNSPGENPWG